MMKPAVSQLPLGATGTDPLIIAHRGGSLEAPENTLASLRHGVACGSAWQEIDVGLSADDACVVLHDDSVDRTTNGTGNLAQWPVSHLTKLFAGTPKWADEARQRLISLGAQVPQFGHTYQDERVPTLEQALAVDGVRLMIELKATTKPETLVRKVSQAVQATNMVHRVIVGSFDAPLVAMLARLAPELPRIGILEDAMMLPYMLKEKVLALAMDAALVARLRPSVPLDVSLWAWTVYTLQQAKSLAAAGADGLITDIPAALTRAARAGLLGD